MNQAQQVQKQAETKTPVKPELCRALHVTGGSLKQWEKR